MEGSNKLFYYLAIFVGSIIGEFVARFFGIGYFSVWGIVISSVFAALAFFITYKIID